MYENMSDKEYRKFMKFVKHEALEKHDKSLVEDYNETIDDRAIVKERLTIVFIKMLSGLSMTLWLLEKLF